MVREEKRRNMVKQNKVFNHLMATTKVRSYEEMVKDAEKTYKAKQAKDEALLQAFADKKLKSKTLIKQAQELKRKQSNKKPAKNAAATV